MVIVFVLSILAPFNLIKAGSDTSCYQLFIFPLTTKTNVLISIILKCSPLL